jgi:4-amino-4-deoxy-L-arabinose transferase-like glycosyltransferase
MHHAIDRSPSLRLKRPTIWALGFAAATLLLRLPFLGLPFDPFDEGYYAAVAQAAVNGRRLFADLWYVRPPFLNVIYEWGYRFSLGTGAPYDVSVRMLAALFAAATVGVLARALFAEFSPRTAFLGSAFAALFAASLTLQNEANAETWMMLPYTLSAVLVFYVALREPPRREAVWTIVLAGALTGVAAAFKQVALVNLALPVLAWIALDPSQVRRWLGRTAAFLGGALGLWAGILLGLAVTDDVRAFLYYAWFRNIAYIHDSHGGVNSLRVLVTNLGGPLAAFSLASLVVLALLGVSLARTGDAPRDRRIALFALGWLCLSAIGVAASGRFYQHYFIQATIPLALLLSASAEPILRAGERTRVSVVGFALIAVLVLASPALSLASDLRGLGSLTARRQAYKDLGQRQLPRLTAPGGSVLVWGIGVSVKAYCPLRSASRLPVVCYDYGWSPTDRGSLMGENFPSTADVVVPELRRAPPDTIVLTVPLVRPNASSPHNDGIRLTSAVYSLVTEHYVVVARGAGYVVLRRRS